MNIKNIFIISKNNPAIYLSCVLLLGTNFLACSSENLKPAPDIINPVPISEIHERFLGSAENCLSSISEVFESNDIAMEETGSDNKFRTKAIRIKDSICDTSSADRVPVPCKVVFQGQILSESSNVSVLRLSYEETCLDQNHISVRCKDSNAERLLFRLHREFSSK